MTTLTADTVRAALTLPDFDAAPAWEQMRMDPPIPRIKPPDEAHLRRAGVLVLLYPVADALTTVLIRRTPDPGVHSGQVGFPGGSVEPQDADTTATALREACEEVGVCSQQVDVLGGLTPVYIPPSNFMVWPVVGLTAARPTFIPNAEEVAGLLELPLHALLNPARKKETPMHIQGITFRVPYYDVDGNVVWGATALMLSELEDRLRRALGPRI